MTVWSNPGRSVNLARPFLVCRQYQRCTNYRFVRRVKCASRTFYNQSLRYSSNLSFFDDSPTGALRRPPRTVDNVAKEIECLEAYLPESLRGRPADPPVSKGANEEDECLTILRLLRETRNTKNTDLLGHLAFELHRWDSVRYIVDKLLENVTSLRQRHPVPSRLPSNIGWNTFSADDPPGPDNNEPLDRIWQRRLDKFFPVSGPRDGFTAADFGAISGPAVTCGLDSSRIQDITLMELWQSLGKFIVEATGQPGEYSHNSMEHIYEILARFQQLDLIPAEVYNAAPSEDARQSRSRAGMPYLQKMIMHVLADASLGARPARSASRGPDDLVARRQRVRMRNRDLDAGNWLEFVLWCCIESGFPREGFWILKQMQSGSNNQWRIKSWNALLQSSGPLVLKRMKFFDTWMECGRNARNSKLFASRKPFLGMGERTITSEVVVAIMDSLMDRARFGQDDEENTPSDIWAIISSLHAMLKRNDLALGTGDVNYLHTRMVESNAIAPANYPVPLFDPVEQARCEMNDEGGDRVSDSMLKSPAVDHGHGASTLVLGLHSYLLNVDAALGYVSRAIGKFETLLGAIDSNKVLEMRDSALEDRYLIDAPPVKDAMTLRRQFFGENKLGVFPDETISSVMLNPISLSLLFDTLTASREHRLGHWLLSGKVDHWDPIVIPNSMFSDPLLAPSLIRFSADNHNRHHFSKIMGSLRTPLPREVLKATATYEVAQCEWENAVEVLRYLPERQDCHWGATNVASIAAAIIKLSERRALGNLVSSQKLRQEHVNRASQLLTSLLQGEFDRMVLASERPYRYQEEQMLQIHRMLRSIPGALQDVCEKASLRRKRHHRPPWGVPVNAFHHLLAAIAKTHGSLAGKRFWSKWCIHPFGSLAKRIRLGPNATSQQADNFAFRINWKSPQGGRWYTSQLGKSVLPNLNTVRIIARRATEEQIAIWRGHATFSSRSRWFGVLDVLSWTIDMFKGFGLTELEINQELDGHLARIRREIADRGGLRYAVGFPRPTQLILWDAKP